MLKWFVTKPTDEKECWGPLASKVPRFIYKGSTNSTFYNPNDIKKPVNKILQPFGRSMTAPYYLSNTPGYYYNSFFFSDLK